MSGTDPASGVNGGDGFGKRLTQVGGGGDLQVSTPDKDDGDGSLFIHDDVRPAGLIDDLEGWGNILPGREGEKSGEDDVHKPDYTIDSMSGNRNGLTRGNFWTRRAIFWEAV